MLTPRFKLKQDDDFIFVDIHAPYSNIKDNDCFIDDYDFIFFASPYFLRLRLPGKLKDTDKCEGRFDCESQSYALKIEKENHGEYFENLDMITNLLIPFEPKTSKFCNGIEVVSALEDLIIVNEENSSINSEKVNIIGYGFGNKNINQLDTFDLFLEVFDCKPGEGSFDDRRGKRIETENSNFSSDHYLADLYDLESIEECLKYQGPWHEHFILNYVHEFTSSEIDLLKELPNKEYLLDVNEKKIILIGIIDIVYPLIYEYRTTANDLNPESSWTINKLSATLSCFESFHSVEECVLSLIRRSLIYPLYRNYDLSLAILNDVKIIFRLGKSYIIKLFIEIHSLFNLSHACRYILNDLYIKDYLIFIQKMRDDDIKWLCEELDKITVTKDKVGLELLELEQAAEIVKNDNVKDCEELIQLMKKCGNYSVVDTDSDDSSSDESEDSTSSSSKGNSTSDDSSSEDCNNCPLYINKKAE